MEGSLAVSRKRSVPHGKCHEETFGVVCMGYFEITSVFPRPGTIRLSSVHFPKDAHGWEKVIKWSKEVATEFFDMELIPRLTSA